MTRRRVPAGALAGFVMAIDGHGPGCVYGSRVTRIDPFWPFMICNSTIRGISLQSFGVKHGVHSLGTRGATVTRDHEAIEITTGETVMPNRARGDNTRSKTLSDRTRQPKSAAALGDGSVLSACGGSPVSGPSSETGGGQGIPRRRGCPMRRRGRRERDCGVQPRRPGSWTVYPANARIRRRTPRRQRPGRVRIEGRGARDPDNRR